MSCASFGQFIMLPVSLGLLQTFGATAAFGILSVLSLLMLVLAIPTFEKPIQQASSQDLSLKEILTEAFNHKGFWLLCFGFFVCGFHILFIMTHVPAFLVDRGLSPEDGTIVLALIGLFNIFGTYSAGVLGQRFPKRYLLSAIYLGRSIAIIGFLVIPLSPLTTYIFAAIMGYLWLSTIPLTNGIVAQIFGVKYLSMLSGLVFFSHQLGSFCGAFFGGYLFDRTGSYIIVWEIAIALGIFAFLVNLPVKERALARVANA
jgi:predicted MFS family arabinose efflux permease